MGGHVYLCSLFEGIVHHGRKILTAGAWDTQTYSIHNQEGVMIVYISAQFIFSSATIQTPVHHPGNDITHTGHIFLRQLELSR